MNKRGWLLAAMIGLACAWPAVAPAEPRPEEAVVSTLDRDPELRQIDDRKDAVALKRLEVVRAKLPAEFRKRNNFAWAVAKIDGVDKAEYFAHSGIQDLEEFSEPAQKQIAEISLKPARDGSKFKTLCVNQNGAVEGADCWERNVDTEFKILEDLASRMEDPSVAGRVRLYTELYPCPSCWNVMKQFLAVYTNVQMQVLYRRD